MSDTLSDPFSQAAATQSGLPSQEPGLLGVSPSQWQNIAQLGAGMIQGANQRTGDGHLANGTGIAGGLAGAVQGYFGSIQNQAKLRSELASQGASTTGKNIDNQMNALGLPLARARNQFQINALQDPGIMQQLGYGSSGGIAGPSGQPMSAPAQSGGSDGASYVNNALEGGPGKNPRSSASGYGQLIDSNKQAFASANPQYFTGAATPQAINARFNDPTVGRAATDWMAHQNAPALTASGVPITGPNLAMAHRLGPQAVSGVNQAADNAPLLSALSQSLGSQKALEYAIANPEMARQTAGQFRSSFANVPAYGPAANGGGNPGDSLLQQADTLTARANRIAQAQNASKLAGIPVGPEMAADPTALHTQAQQLRQSGLELNAAGPKASATANAEAGVKMATAGPISMAEKGYAMGPDGTASAIPGGPTDPNTMYAQEQAKSEAQTNSIRGEGGGVIQAPAQRGGTPNIIQSPISKEITGPDNVKYRITQNSIENPAQPWVRPQNVPDWAPEGTLTVSKAELSPTEKKSQEESSEDAFGERANHAYQGAIQTRANMEMVRQNLKVLDQDPGFLSTGAGGSTKLAIAKTINSSLASMGLPQWIDADKVAAGESLEHQSRIGGMQAVSSLLGASHEAASVVQSTQSAFPNADNTPEGAKSLVAGLDNSAAYLMDKHVFMSNWATQNPGKSLVGADTAFQAQRPAQMYTRRAISMVKPYEVSSPDEMKRYLPGTRVILKGGDGTIRTIPGQQDLVPASGAGQP